MSEALRASETFVVDPGVHCRCKNAAAALLEIHSVGFCTPTERSIASFKCRECLKTDLERAQNVVSSGVVFCVSCGLVVSSLSDLVVRMTPVGAG